MTNSKATTTVDEYFGGAEKWREELERLRAIVLDCELTEELKWNTPWYTYDGKVIVGIYGFKGHPTLMFFKGALLSDPDHILDKPGPNSESGRVVRFGSIQDIARKETILKAYIQEAIEAEKAGLKVEYKDVTEYAVPEELENKFYEMPELREAFEALTPGRQKGYLLYFSAPKLSQTREARIEKCIDLILDGIGLHDQYT